MSQQDNETYLGDAVFVSFDHFTSMIKLRTGDITHQVIYLEPGVWAALQQWAKDFFKDRTP